MKFQILILVFVILNGCSLSRKTNELSSRQSSISRSPTQTNSANQQISAWLDNRDPVDFIFRKAYQINELSVDGISVHRNPYAVFKTINSLFPSIANSFRGYPLESVHDLENSHHVQEVFISAFKLIFSKNGSGLIDNYQWVVSEKPRMSEIAIDYLKLMISKKVFDEDGIKVLSEFMQSQLDNPLLAKEIKERLINDNVINDLIALLNKNKRTKKYKKISFNKWYLKAKKIEKSKPIKAKIYQALVQYLIPGRDYHFDEYEADKVVLKNTFSINTIASKSGLTIIEYFEAIQNGFITTNFLERNWRTNNIPSIFDRSKYLSNKVLDKISKIIQKRLWDNDLMDEKGFDFLLKEWFSIEASAKYPKLVEKIIRLNNTSRYTSDILIYILSKKHWEQLALKHIDTFFKNSPLDAKASFAFSLTNQALEGKNIHPKLIAYALRTRRSMYPSEFKYILNIFNAPNLVNDISMLHEIFDQLDLGYRDSKMEKVEKEKLFREVLVGIQSFSLWSQSKPEIDDILSSNGTTIVAQKKDIGCVLGISNLIKKKR